MFGTVQPTELAGRCAATGALWLTGLISLIPYAWRTWQSSRAATDEASASSSGAAPESTTRTEDRSRPSTSGDFPSVLAVEVGVNTFTPDWAG